MPRTRGLNHLGLAVRDLNDTTAFFTEALGWSQTAHDPGYPRSTVTDGSLRLTLWQVDRAQDIRDFDRRTNIGLHHLAMEVETEAHLQTLAETIDAYPGTTIEFMPEFMGTGPRKHMMFTEPGGIRLELIWPGT